MIRLLTPADAEWTATLIRTAFATHDATLDPPPSALRVTGADITAHFAERGGGAGVDAEACLLWRPDPGALYIGRLAVHPAARGRGLATALLIAAEQVARTAGLASLRLQVRLSLTDNRRLFQRTGFVEGAHHAHPGYDTPTYLEAEKHLLP